MKKPSIIVTAAALAAAAGIAVGGAALTASADSTATSPSASATSQSQPGTAPQRTLPDANGNTDPGKPMRSDEQLLTGDVAAKVTAAAKAKEPGATIQRVETDSEGVYEAHMVRADGTAIIVQIDKNFAVTNVQEGFGGRGGPGAPGAPASPSATGAATT